MNEAGTTRADVTRQKILDAAARQFARRTFSAVNLDDIIAETDVSRGALYFHFQSKHALALAIIEHHAAAIRASTTELFARRPPGMEALIEVTFMVATLDGSDEYARASVNLADAARRPGGPPAGAIDEWTQGAVAVLEQAIADGDVRSDCDPVGLAQVLISHYLGVRHVSALDDTVAFLTTVKNSWCFTLPGFANPDRLDYLLQFVERRAASAIREIAARRG